MELEDISEIEAENHIFKENHTLVGTNLAEVWSLPEMVRSVIAHYNNPSTATKFQTLSYGINVSKEYVDRISAKDFGKLENISLSNFKNYNTLDSMIHISDKKRMIDEKMKELIVTLPDSYVLFK